MNDIEKDAIKAKASKIVTKMSSAQGWIEPDSTKIGVKVTNDNQGKLTCMTANAGSRMSECVSALSRNLHNMKNRDKARKIALAVQDLNRMDRLETKAEFSSIRRTLSSVRVWWTSESHYLYLPFTTTTFNTSVDATSYDSADDVAYKLEVLTAELRKATQDPALLHHLHAGSGVNQALIQKLVDYLERRGNTKASTPVAGGACGFGGAGGVGSAGGAGSVQLDMETASPTETEVHSELQTQVNYYWNEQ